MGGGDGEADRRGDVAIAVPRIDGRPLHRTQAALPQRDADRAVGARGHERELVAANARDGVLAPGHSRQGARDGLQDAIPGGVAVAVVDPLEVVEIDDRHREQGGWVGADRDQGITHDSPEGAPVGKAGEGVVRREHPRIGLGPGKLTPAVEDDRHEHAGRRDNRDESHDELES